MPYPANLGPGSQAAVRMFTHGAAHAQSCSKDRRPVTLTWAYPAWYLYVYYKDVLSSKCQVTAQAKPCRTPNHTYHAGGTTACIN